MSMHLAWLLWNDEKMMTSAVVDLCFFFILYYCNGQLWYVCTVGLVEAICCVMELVRVFRVCFATEQCIDIPEAFSDQIEHAVDFK